MKKFTAIILVIISTAMLLGGCWNQRELTDLAFVLAMGVDKGTKGEKFNVSFQVVVPANVSSGQMGGGGQGPPVVVYKSSGNTLTEASRKATKEIPRSLYYAHTNLLVISEELARDGILDLLDALDRDSVFRTTTLAVIAKGGKAEDLISTLTNLDKLPVNKFTKTLEATEEMLGENIKVNIDDIITNIIDPGKEPVISGFILNGSPKKGKSPQNIDTTTPPTMIAADGLAVFRNGKLVGWLSHNKVRGAIWVMNKMKGTNVNFDWNGKKDAVSMTPYFSKTKTDVHNKNGKLSIDITVETVFKLSEVNAPIEVNNPQNISELEKKTAEAIKRDIEVSVQAAKKYKADIFGFGDNVHHVYPKLWKKIKNNWDNEFAQMAVNIEVKAFYREAGIRNNPFWLYIKNK